MEQLLQKLAISKQIMDRHNQMERGQSDRGVSIPQQNLQNFDIPSAKYNIPQEFLQENTPSVQVSSTSKISAPPSIDAIKKSRLPDEIKRLMIEHPIEKPQQASFNISDDLIERASRLMKEQPNNYIPDSAKTKTAPQTSIPTKQTSSNPDFKKLIQEAVEETLRKHGVISESSEKTNEIFSFKVGKHIFEGKITKVKKIS